MFHQVFIFFPPCYCTYLRMSQGTRTYATAETGDSKEPMQEQRNTWMTLEFPPTVCFYYSIHHLYCDKNTLNLELKPRLSWKELNQRFFRFFKHQRAKHARPTIAMFWIYTAFENWIKRTNSLHPILQFRAEKKRAVFEQGWVLVGQGEGRPPPLTHLVKL